MTRRPDPALHVVHPHAAAVDVHSDNHVVCVGPDRVRTFAAYSADLAALADWLRSEGVTSVVLESTGVYWIPLFELLERRGFEVFLIEPSQASHCGAGGKGDTVGEKGTFYIIGEMGSMHRWRNEKVECPLFPPSSRARPADLARNTTSAAAESGDQRRARDGPPDQRGQASRRERGRDVDEE